MAMQIASVPVAGLVWRIDFYERAVLNGCAHEVSSGSRQGTVRIARIFTRSPMLHPTPHGDGSA
jgi:hypothetical protein